MKRRLPVVMTDCCVETTHVMYQYTLGYKQFRLQVNLRAMKITICPYTRAYNILGLVRPLLVANDNKLLGDDEVFLATTEELPGIHPKFAMLTIFEEATFNILMTGLDNAELYHVRLQPTQLDPNATLIRIPSSITDTKHTNADNVTQALWEDCQVGFNQMTLTGILHSHHVEVMVMLDALAAWFCAYEGE